MGKGQGSGRDRLTPRAGRLWSNTAAHKARSRTRLHLTHEEPEQSGQKRRPPREEGWGRLAGVPQAGPAGIMPAQAWVRL